MTTGNVVQSGSGAAQAYGGSGHEPANLGDILERVLDKGIVIAGDIQVNLLDIELLTIKLRLVIASLDTAREVGINWWESDPWLSASAARSVDRGKRGDHELAELRDRVAELESGQRRSTELEPGEPGSRRASSRRRDDG